MADKAEEQDFLASFTRLQEQLRLALNEFSRNPSGGLPNLVEVRRELGEWLDQYQLRGGKPLTSYPNSEQQAVLSVRVSDDITPAELAEILTALDTLHRELTGTQLRNLLARIGQEQHVESIAEQV